MRRTDLHSLALDTFQLPAMDAYQQLAQPPKELLRSLTAEKHAGQVILLAGGSQVNLDPELARGLGEGVRVIKQYGGVFDTFPLSLLTIQSVEGLSGLVGHSLVKKLRYVAVFLLITLSSMIFGLVSLWSSHNGNFALAAWMIVYAVLTDRLDGLVARAVKGTSELGMQLDSFADSLNFGIAPAFLILTYLSGRPDLPYRRERKESSFAFSIGFARSRRRR